jgi:hypothetical protein
MLVLMGAVAHATVVLCGQGCAAGYIRQSLCPTGCRSGEDQAKGM